MIWDSQHGLTKGKFCLTNLLDSSDEVTTHEWPREEMLFILTSIKLVTQSPTTSFSLKWGEMDSMDGVLGG